MCEDIKIPTMLFIRQTAKLTGVSEWHIRQLVSNDKIYYIKIENISYKS